MKSGCKAKLAAWLKETMDLDIDQETFLHKETPRVSRRWLAISVIFGWMPSGALLVVFVVSVFHRKAALGRLP